MVEVRVRAAMMRDLNDVERQQRVEQRLMILSPAPLEVNETRVTGDQNPLPTMFNADDIAQLITWRDGLNFHVKSERLGKIGATSCASG